MVEGRERLKSNPYPGRGIIVGLDATGRLALQLYWITARSAGSRNRVLAVEDGEVVTRPYDESARTDDPNIYYRAIASAGHRHVVSNGNHTDVIMEYLSRGRSFEEAVRTTSFETDEPNYTPRIAALADVSSGSLEAGLGRAVRGPDGQPYHNLYVFQPQATGVGFCFHTYASDGDPLPSFTDAPYEFELRGSPEDVASDLWELLPAEKRVALALKAIDLRTKKVVTLTVHNALG